VDGLDLTLRPGQSLGLVGESGSGKTTTARILLGLTGHDGGAVQIAGRAWADATTRAGRRALYRVVQPVFQDPYSSLDPSHSVADSIAEPLRYLGDLSRQARSARVLELLDAVHLPRSVSRRKPHELSGGQLQRVAIARALAVRPRVLVCDEPVSSLDVSIQDQILRLLAELREQSDLAYLFISHDLAVIHQICHDVIVMRDGQVVERGRTAEVFTNPATDYAKEFLASIPGRRAAVSQ
jgi:peptide/nickel transport system ATP-binding protein